MVQQPAHGSEKLHAHILGICGDCQRGRRDWGVGNEFWSWAGDSHNDHDSNGIVNDFGSDDDDCVADGGADDESGDVYAYDHGDAHGESYHIDADGDGDGCDSFGCDECDWDFGWLV